MDTPYAPVKSFQGDLLTILYSQLCAAHDVAVRLGELTDETDPLRVSHDVQLIKGNIIAAMDRLNDIRP